jgi:hypothetical protein|tara:strand:- start:366 stop:590 length:225 start_codon:yes stop_codon:yes gene_type:complete
LAGDVSKPFPHRERPHRPKRIDAGEVEDELKLDNVVKLEFAFEQKLDEVNATARVLAGEEGTINAGNDLFSPHA